MFVNRKLVFFVWFVIFSFGSLAENTEGTYWLKPTYNVLFLGQSGAGKSSVINMLYNSLGRVPYGESWKIVIPLYHKPTAYPVTVKEYIDYKVTLKPGGGSQTSEVNKYTVETEREKIVFWDTPGFSDTAGFEKDLENAEKIVAAIADTSFHAVIIPLKSDNIDRGSETDEFHVTVNHIRRMLPKTFSSNIIGLFNKVGLESPTREDGLRDGFFEAFKVSAGEKDLKSKVYFVDGSGFFAKMDDRLSPLKLKIGKVQWEEGDGLTFEEMVQVVRTNTPVSGYDALKIQQLIHGLEGWILYLAEVIADQQLLETKLGIIKNDLEHAIRERDLNQNYKKESFRIEILGPRDTYDDYKAGRKEWEGSQAQKWDTLQNMYKSQNGDFCTIDKQKAGCQVKFPITVTDENILARYNTALLAITNKINETSTCETDIKNLKNKRTKIVDKIVEVQKEWEKLAMTTDLTPMIRQVEKKMKEIDANSTKQKPEKDAELSVLRQIRDVYYEMQRKTPNL